MNMFRTMHGKLLPLITIVLISTAIALGQTWPADGPVAAPGGPAAGLHITGTPMKGSMLKITDGAGFVWDITNRGMVNDGSGDAFDGAMQLSVNGSQFNAGSATVSADGREIECGKLNLGNVEVSRRIYVDAKEGYCRWIDIFENKTGSELPLSVQYYTNTGGSTGQVLSASGKAEVTDKDWAAVTGPAGPSSNPSIVHILSSPNSRVRPTLQYRLNDDNLYYNATLSIPGNKTVALCFFEAQRKTFNDARKTMLEFDLEAELAKVPAPLAAILVNMGSTSSTAIGRSELVRSSKYDVAKLRNGTEMQGRCEISSFIIDTAVGKLEFPPAKVLGFATLNGGDSSVLLALTDGQIIAGKLQSPATFVPNGQDAIVLSMNNLASLAYQVTTEKPMDFPFDKPAVITRSLQRLYFAPGDADLTFYTEYGEFKLDPQIVETVQLDIPEGGLHRVVFRNGSVLSGLLKVQRMKLRLELGGVLDVRTAMIDRLVFSQPGKTLKSQSPATASKPAESQPMELTLRNDDVLIGQLSQQTLNIQFGGLSRNIACKDVQEIRFATESAGDVDVVLRDGTTVKGRIDVAKILFRLDNGPEIPISTGHAVRLIRQTPKKSSELAKAAASPTTAALQRMPGTVRAVRPVNVITSVPASRASTGPSTASAPASRVSTKPSTAPAPATMPSNPWAD